MLHKVNKQVRYQAAQLRRYARLHPLGRADRALDPGYFARPWPDVTWGVTLNR